jgi:hypothetical protein
MPTPLGMTRRDGIVLDPREGRMKTGPARVIA